MVHVACQIGLGSLEQNVALVWHPAMGEHDPAALQSHWGAAIKIVNFIDCRRRDVIERILRHWGLWQGSLRTLASTRRPPARPSQVPEPWCDVELVLDPELVAAEAVPSDMHRSRELPTRSSRHETFANYGHTGRLIAKRGHKRAGTGEGNGRKRGGDVAGGLQFWRTRFKIGISQLFWGRLRGLEHAQFLG